MSILKESNNRRTIAEMRGGIMSDRDSPEPPKKTLRRENGSGITPTNKTRRSYSPEAPINYHPMTGVPQPAVPTKLTAPVHIDIGGTIYTSTLQHLTKFPNSRLAKLFNGTIPIILDTMKQHYFIDRDGPSFRHTLNFLRDERLTLPQNYGEIDILLEEAQYYEIEPLVEAVLEYKSKQAQGTQPLECIALNISPDMGERITLSGNKLCIEKCFPELAASLANTRSSGWISNNDYVIKFPINGFSKLNSIEVMERLLKNGFDLASSNGGGVEGQQFSEFIFTRLSK